MIISAVNAIKNHRSNEAHLAAICEPYTQILAIKILTLLTKIIVVTKIIACVSERRKGAFALTFSFLLCDNKKNGVIPIVSNIM